MLVILTLSIFISCGETKPKEETDTVVKKVEETKTKVVVPNQKLTAEQQIASAVLAAPEETRAGAKVYGYDEEGKFVQVIAIKNQKLVLYNSFDYQSSEDFIYYLLFVLDQLEINNETASINLTGEIKKDALIYSMLYKYIQNLSFGERPENLKFSYIFEFFNLFLLIFPAEKYLSVSVSNLNCFWPLSQI